MVNSIKIKARLIEIGKTQKELAEAIGVKQPTASQKINNLRPMSLNEAEKAANFLEVKDEEFRSFFLI